MSNKPAVPLVLLEFPEDLSSKASLLPSMPVTRTYPVILGVSESRAHCPDFTLLLRYVVLGLLLAVEIRKHRPPSEGGISVAVPESGLPALEALLAPQRLHVATGTPGVLLKGVEGRDITKILESEASVRRQRYLGLSPVVHCRLLSLLCLSPQSEQLIFSATSRGSLLVEKSPTSEQPVSANWKKE